MINNTHLPWKSTVVSIALRSHGGLTEQAVPLLVNRKVNCPIVRGPRDFDVFAIALNHVPKNYVLFLLLPLLARSELE